MRAMPTSLTCSSSKMTRSACSSVSHSLRRSRAARSRPFSRTSRSPLRSAASASRGTYVHPSRSSSTRAGSSAWLYSLSLDGVVMALAFIPYQLQVGDVVEITIMGR